MFAPQQAAYETRKKQWVDAGGNPNFVGGGQMIYNTRTGQSYSGGGAYGGVPQQISLADSQNAAIQANQRALAQLQQQSQQLNNFNQQQFLNQYRGLNPAFDSSYAQAGQNAMGMLAGQLPPEVIQQLQQNAAEFGLNAGVSGSQLQSYQGLRNLGLTTLDLMNRGQQNLLSLTGGSPTAGITNPAASFITPGQQQETAQYNAALAAAPDPQAAAENALRIAQQAQRSSSGGPYRPTGGMSVDPSGISRPRSSSSITDDIISRYASPMNPTGYQGGTQYGTAQAQPASQYTADDWWREFGGTSQSLTNANVPGYWDDINALDDSAFDDLIASLV